VAQLDNNIDALNHPEFAADELKEIENVLREK
jgi:hypothetical protein